MYYYHRFYYQVIFPYEGMPEVAQYIAEALLATHFMLLVRGAILRDVGFTDMLPDVFWLTLFNF